MAKRNRTISLLALPFAASIWFVGWIFCSVNSKKRDIKVEPKHFHKIV